MPEALLTILKFFLVALVYLFFFRVLRAVWAEVRAVPQPVAAQPASAAPSRPARQASPPAKPARLNVIEPAENRGSQFDLGEELTIGRADGCRIRLDDSFTSQLHARIFQRDGQLFVEDLGSTNGTYLNRRGTQAKEKVAGPLALKLGDRLMIGKTVLEVAK